MSTMVALPTSSDPAVWSPEESALVEASGLVHTDSRSGSKTLADRPTVAAFLQHCQRTGLDPIARQIYCIARKSKGQLRWQTQISIDGARLVAERSGEYEGQTTPEFTADGVTWTQVWLASDFPKAARVGVYRRGFREPLYVVALWDAYVQTDYQGAVTQMWRNMGPLMLAKCAEMLALRKAFPQDLSGLYSAEEMAQASNGAPVPQPAPAPSAAELDRRNQEVIAAQGNIDRADDGALLRTNVPDSEVVDAEVVDEAAAPAEPVIDAEAWALRIQQCTSVEMLRALYEEAQGLGVLGAPFADGVPLGQAIKGFRARLEGTA